MIDLKALVLMKEAIDLLDASGTMRLTACHLQLAIDTFESELAAADAVSSKDMDATMP
ncbi:hypothetical protein [Sphingomonas nostoxanthinifaciens]|uniref:hypothetical protein n=1 Tax=Sphingomonas nostoxanthinifaciens TaxID=2872652 RepID=UPI001CC1E3FB|nr:hypothetical protein [Sphingomonas nostoxanthinifaciens]UAK25574.1 hypothetical protein K8P63_05315 [Sphingomonas nostoxanthinifaciens]